MSASDDPADQTLRERVDLWREQIGATAALPGTSAGPDDLDLMMLVGGTSSMIRLVGATEASPDALRDVARELAAARDRQLDELGPGLAVNAIVICDADAVSRESYRVCESLGVELICFNDTHDRPRLAQIVTVQAENLPGGHPAVHPSHQSGAEQHAEQHAEPDPVLAEDDGADDTPLGLDELDDDGRVPQSWSWNDEHPYELRLFWQEEPDFDMPSTALQGLTGAALAERKLQMARAYFGFDPDSAGIPCPLVLHGYETVFFVLSGSGLVEYRQPPPPPATGGPNMRVGAFSRITSGTFLTMSTRVGSPTAAPAPTDEVLSPVDDGDIIITTRRVAFVGERMHRDWHHDQMISSRIAPLHVEGFPPMKALLMSTSNRSKVSGFYLDPDLVGTLEFMITLARCESTEERQALVRSLA